VSDPHSAEERARRRNRRSLLFIAAIAVVPVVAAYVTLYFFPEFIPKDTTNKGTLIDPPISADKLSAGGRMTIPQGKWTLLLPAGVDCDATCRHGLYLARQVNMALGKDASRLTRVLLVSGSRLSSEFHDLIEREYPHMLVQYRAPGVVAGALGHIAPSGALDGFIFLSDPRGNIMMYYPPGSTGKDILSDVKHLLGSGR
jgi:cytochrome oxidase Cu insertion factor (SCO1/SenC/PrrC family)